MLNSFEHFCDTTLRVWQRSDAMAAALSMLRFALLRQLAAKRSDGQAAPTAAAAAAVLPPTLQPPALAALLRDHLAPLRACVGRALQLHAAAREDAARAGGGGGDASAVESQGVEAFLAVVRLEEGLEAVHAAAKELAAGRGALGER